MPRNRSRESRKTKENMKDYGLSNSEIEHLIDEWIPNEKHRKIMKRRLIDGVIFDDLAEEFELSVRQTKNIVYKCEERLFKHIK